MNRKELLRICVDLEIEVPKGTKTDALYRLISEYYSKTAAVHTDECVSFEITDLPTKRYMVHFQLTGCIDIIAEDEEAASRWTKETLGLHIDPFMPYYLADMPEVEIWRVEENN